MTTKAMTVVCQHSDVLFEELVLLPAHALGVEWAGLSAPSQPMNPSGR